MRHALHLYRLQPNPARLLGIWIGQGGQVVSSRRIALGNIWRRRLEFRNVVAWQILSYTIAAPDAVHSSTENLTGIKVECNFDGLARLHIFEVLLEICCEQIAVCIRDKGGDAADPICASHHSRADLKVDDMTVLRRG